MEKRDYAYTSLLYSVIGILSCFFLNTVAFGQIRIVDADTIILNKEKIRLHGIDAPETEQSCYIEDQAWSCGKEATEYLRSYWKVFLRNPCFVKYLQRIAMVGQ